jgi:S1-C subfamily serine protease
VRRAFLGVVGGTRPLPPRLAHRLGRTRALEVVQLLDRSPAASAGVRPGDLVVELDGRPIEGVADLQRVLVGELVGRAVGVRVARGDRLVELELSPTELRA